MNRRLLVVAFLLVSVSTGCSGPGDVSCPVGLAECSGACVDTQADDANCGTCGNVCGAGKVCNAGTCAVVLLGSGTAADPYHASPVPGSCLGYMQLTTTPPATADGVYVTHPAAADIGVYCDVTHGGWTYESFGTGQYTASYPGWAPVGAADFQGSRQFDEAFAYLFGSSGLVNLQPGFTSSICGIIDRATGGCYGLAGYSLMSLSKSGTRYCNPAGGYTLPSYVLAVSSDSTNFTERTSFTALEAGNVATRACYPNGDPGIFVKRYQ